MVNAEARQAANKVLAEAIGYRIERRNDAYDALIAPDGAEVEVDSHALDTGWEDAPDFFASVDAVLETIPHDYFDVKINALLAGGYVARIYEDDPLMGYKHTWEGRGATRAIALANARLAMAQAQRGGE